MNVVYRDSFLRDVRKLRDRSIEAAVDRATDDLEAAASLADVRQLKKLKGAAHHYRIRVGEYRIGIYVDKGTVECVCCLHRREVYRFFP